MTPRERGYLQNPAWQYRLSLTSYNPDGYLPCGHSCDYVEHVSNHLEAGRPETIRIVDNFFVPVIVVYQDVGEYPVSGLLMQKGKPASSRTCAAPEPKF